MARVVFTAILQRRVDCRQAVAAGARVREALDVFRGTITHTLPPAPAVRFVA